MLMAAGLEPPQSVFGHGFWMSEGRKMSKTVGNFIEPLRLIEWLADLSGAHRPIAVDAFRYFIFREMPFGEDGNFARHSLLQRFNSDLANDLGNALNRSLSLTHQNFGAVVPPATEAETRLRDLAREVHDRVGAALDRFDLQAALEVAWEYVGVINKYLDDRAPWALAREGKKDELGGVLYHALEAVRAVSVWIAPYMPCAADEIRRQLGIAGKPEWAEGERWGILQAGAHLELPAPIFPRIEKKKMQEALRAIEMTSAETPAPAPAQEQHYPPAAAAAVGADPAPQAQAEAEADPFITIDDFVKVELRVAEVLSAERVPKADKLLNLRVSLGDEERTVLAGMAEYYQPEELVGRKVIMVANLAPRKMRGLESQGMLLAAEGDGKVSLLQPDQDLPAGSRIR
jgi:methionyl-tRNA synthetase